MKVHEFQAKQLLRDAGVAVPRGIVVRSPQEAEAAFAELNGTLAVVKAQIHAGGRGKGTLLEHPTQHGVQLVRSADEARDVAGRLLGNRLVTHADGTRRAGRASRAGRGRMRHRPRAVPGDRLGPRRSEARADGLPRRWHGHRTGGRPDAASCIFKEHFQPHVGLQDFQVRKLCSRLGLTGASAKSAPKFMQGLCRAFVHYDCSLAEVNPLVVTKSGDLLALDAKMSFDDNALFRHPEVASGVICPRKNRPRFVLGKAGLSYVKLDGNIGCLVNGAGLAMSTMDLIKLHGGQPANFLDVGGGADVDQVTEAFRILLDDRNVRAVLVNIFGGIMRCTTIATALVEAYKTVGFGVPLVVRLEGTEVEQGRRILAESGADIIAADGLTDAAQKVVAGSHGARLAVSARRRITEIADTYTRMNSR